jgi:diguanylate cyclase (GGDEF)-like protein/PAS domain S-box-containing protein
MVERTVGLIAFTEGRVVARLMAGVFAMLTSLSWPLAATESPVVTLTPEERVYLESLGPITVCPDPDWPPFESLDEDGQFVGIGVDLLELVGQRLGIAFQYVIAPSWDEALTRSRAGEVLILPFLNQTPAREEWLTFTEPLLVEPNVFITREEHPFISDATQLFDETVVLPVGTSMEERIRRDFPNLDILTVDTEKTVFQSIVNRAADLTVRSLSVAAYTIRKEGLFNLKIAGQAPERYTNHLRIGVLKTEPRLRDILDRSIATISARERQAIINRHVHITVLQPFDYGFVLRIAAVLLLLIGVSFWWNWRLQRAHAAVRESERSKSVLIANLPGLAYRCRFDQQWTMQFLSEGCLALTGYPSSALIDNHEIAFVDLIHPDDRAYTVAVWDEAYAQNIPAVLEYRIYTADHQERWVYERGVFIEQTADGTPLIEGLIIDITDRKQAEQEVYRISIHDHLTGLYNRRYILEQLETLLAQAVREDSRLAVAILDLDHFKSVNDTYGHGGGDCVLVEIATLLREGVRSYDLVARYGGEEFIIVATSEAAVLTAMLERMREAVRIRVFDYQGHVLHPTFSAGVAERDEFGPKIKVEQLIARADARLYHAKSAGRDRICANDSKLDLVPEIGL